MYRETDEGLCFLSLTLQLLSTRFLENNVVQKTTKGTHLPTILQSIFPDVENLRVIADSYLGPVLTVLEMLNFCYRALSPLSILIIGEKYILLGTT